MGSSPSREGPECPGRPCVAAPSAILQLGACVSTQGDGAFLLLICHTAASRRTPRLQPRPHPSLYPQAYVQRTGVCLPRYCLSRPSQSTNLIKTHIPA